MALTARDMHERHLGGCDLAMFFAASQGGARGEDSARCREQEGVLGSSNSNGPGVTSASLKETTRKMGGCRDVEKEGMHKEI